MQLNEQLINRILYALYFHHAEIIAYDGIGDHSALAEKSRG